MGQTRKARPDSRTEWLRLSGIPWIGETVKAGLVKRFKEPEAVFCATKDQLSKVKGWSMETLDKFIQHGRTSKPACEPQLLDQKGIRLVTYNDVEYPRLLREIPDSPIALFATGSLDTLHRPHITVVGARNATQTGFDIAREFGRELSAAGFVVVSGMALGIDTYVHKGAVEGGGLTIAVLGCGPDVPYPAGNRSTRVAILQSGGGLISEYSPGTVARPWHFPVRNRIISGMSLATLVIEASVRSGSLITARLAADQNRDVYAVPGNIRSELSQGTLALIKEGATMVTSPQELITHYKTVLANNNDNSGSLYEDDLTPDEVELIKKVSGEPVPIDILLEQRYWNRERLFSMLLTLEMRDILVKLPGNRYQAKQKIIPGRQQV